MLQVAAWYPYGDPTTLLGANTVSQALDTAKARGFTCVRIQVETGWEVFRFIGSEWVCTAVSQ